MLDEKKKKKKVFGQIARGAVSLSDDTHEVLGTSEFKHARIIVCMVSRSFH